MDDLQDEEAVVVQVDALPLEHVGDLPEAALAAVHVVIAAVVAHRCARDHKARAWYHLERLVILQKSKLNFEFKLVSIQG